MRRLILIALAGIFSAGACVAAQTASVGPASSVAKPYRADRIIIQPKSAAGSAALARFHAQRGSRVWGTFAGAGQLQVLEVPVGETVESLVVQYQQSGLVEFAEPDYLVYASATLPNDPKFSDGTLWGLNNTGQNGGTTNADIDAPEGWDVLTSASNIVVAVLDSGINYNHEDLAANMWVSPVDGSHGWNAVATNNLPLDDGGHGSLVAGVLGAVGNNGKGVVGVAWQVQMMACKCLTAAGSGSDSDLIACIDYARTNGARIINASLDSPSFSLALSNAIIVARDAGIIWVASAGNGTSAGRNVDNSPSYPACYQIDNIVAVAYTTRNDTLGFLSNYGATNVDLAAPGDEVYSTLSGASNSYYPPSNFIKIAGTSFSAPCVAGACALLMAQYPADKYRDTIARLLNATDPLPSLAGKCRTGGRLNLRKALRTIRVAALPAGTNASFQLQVAGGLGRTCTVETTTNLVSWMPVFTNTTSTNGTFDFADDSSTNTPARFFRATAAP